MVERYLQRFDLNQRLQHLALIISFTALAVTGLPMMFHEAGISQWWVNLLGGIEVTRVIHRIAAIGFAGVLVYHLIYIFWRVVIKKESLVGLVRIILPGIQDVRGLGGMFGHYLGLARRGPRWDRYDAMQKLEYWAGAWGLIIMVITGVVNWFPVETAKLLPGFVIPLAKAIHGWEAVLAVFWVIAVHLYSVVWSRHVFPLDLSIWTGRISHERLKEEHPAEHKRVHTSEAS